MDGDLKEINQFNDDLPAESKVLPVVVEKKKRGRKQGTRKCIKCKVWFKAGSVHECVA